MSEFDEFDNDDDFANFDLDAVVASHTPSKRPQEDSGASNDPNKRSKPPVGMSNSCASVAMSPDATGSNPAISQQDEHDAILANELEAIPAQFQNAMAHTLQRHFGHSTFRPGQLTILYSLLGDGGNGSTSGNQPKDACVFWATGAGKSLCYQAPPLHLNEVAIVITPLVSLMQDQCAKLNGRVGNDMEIATYLGSSQSNYQAEEKALNGEYRLVYVTPEKLVGGGGVFLDRLARMHQLGGKGRICLIAVDESHCVSEWVSS